MENRQKLDAVTIGDIRAVKIEKRDSQIDTLVKLLKRPVTAGDLGPKKAFDNVMETVEELRELDLLAGLPGLIESLKRVEAPGA